MLLAHRVCVALAASAVLCGAVRTMLTPTWVSENCLQNQDLLSFQTFKGSDNIVALKLQEQGGGGKGNCYLYSQLSEFLREGQGRSNCFDPISKEAIRDCKGLQSLLNEAVADSGARHSLDRDENDQGDETIPMTEEISLFSQYVQHLKNHVEECLPDEHCEDSELFGLISAMVVEIHGFLAEANEGLLTAKECCEAGINLMSICYEITPDASPCASAAAAADAFKRTKGKLGDHTIPQDHDVCGADVIENSIMEAADLAIDSEGLDEE